MRKEDMTNEISNSKIASGPILEEQDIFDAETEYNGPGAVKVSQKSQIQNEIMEYRLKSKSRTRKAQAALEKSGFYKGAIDGKLGPQTKKAIKAFQRSKGLSSDGVIGVKTWEEILKVSKN